MRITFKRIEIHNYKSFADEVFDFNTHTGLNLICGKNNDIPGSKNGSGKSSLCQALLFSLYGQTQDNIKNANVANKYMKSKEVRVVTYFEIEGHEYKVASGFDKRGGPYCQLSEIVEGDEVDLTRSTMTETRKYIANELLHCDMSIFLRTVFLSSDQNYNFFRLKKGEKKEFIEKLFNIQVFGQMYWIIHKDVLEHEKQLISQQNKLIVINKNVETLKERAERYVQEAVVKAKELVKLLESTKQKKEQIQKEAVDANSDEVEKYQEKIGKLTEAIRSLQQKIDEAKGKSQKITISQHKLSASTEQKQKVIEKHKEILQKLCDDCKQIFSDYYNISQYKTDIENNNAKCSELEEKNTKLKDDISKMQQKVDACNNAIDQCQKHITELTAAYNRATKNLANVDAQIETIEKSIAQQESTENPFTELLKNAEVDLDGETTALNEMTEKHKYLSFAENIVSQDTLRKFIISDLIGLLNNKIKSYLTKFGVKYQVVFDSDMNYEFTTDGGVCEYDNFSSGERARLMIAACFAFRDFMYIRNNFSSNILILDEFIDGAIDSLAIDSVLEILKDFSKVWNQNIYVISHRKEISNDVFDNIIQVVKTHNISKITYIE